MWKVPKKYTTTCVSTLNGKKIQQMELEAINREEAVSRAYLNCLLTTEPDKNIKVDVTRL
ncbi:MAG TPA: hypothetical protein PK544_08720 [Spirochaetota bacterium]|nr:hypothetical protein [Spirochaetota bacterium]